MNASVIQLWLSGDGGTRPPPLRGAAGKLDMPGLVFGLCCDGPTWPETVDGTETNIGSAIVGPLGLVSSIETVLGIRRPSAPAVRRIAAMRAKLKAADDGRRCWSRSFEADPWSTARLLLSWRDELVEAGWAPVDNPTLSSRLRDVCAAEKVGPVLPPGFADRCAAILCALASRPAMPWDSVIMVEPADVLAPGLRRIVDALGACGVEVRQRDAIAPASGDLGRLQRLLAEGEGERLVGDGSVVVVRADTEAMAAEALADWTDAGSQHEHGGTVFVLDAPSGTLDAAFARRNLPRFGYSRPSPARAALQVLRLAIATRWAPFDPFNLMELLLLPGGPIPRDVAGVLTRVLAETPGRGGPAWTAALAEAEALRRERFEKEGLVGAQLAHRVGRDAESWRAWVLPAVHDAETGMPTQEVLQVCSAVTAWAAQSDDGDALRMRVAAAATDLASAAIDLGERFLSRRLLSRMVDEAIGSGMSDPASEAQAAAWSAVHSPGAVWDAADTVVWWAPSGTLAPRTGPWTKAEANALADCGCAIADGAKSMASAAHSWRQPILNARRRVILVVSKTVGGEAGDDHPLMHEMRALLNDAPPGVIVRAEDLLTGPQEIAGRQCGRVPIARVPLPAPARRWNVPAGSVRRPESASATSIELMLGCRFSWVARNAANLWPGARASIPAGERLLGLLAHAVARDIFPPGAPPKPDDALRRAKAAVEDLLVSEAAPLLLPGNATDLARARIQIPRAMEQLARQLSRAALTVVGTEVEIPANKDVLPAVEVHGRMDMLLAAPSGASVVLDMKWTGTDRYRRAELVEGRPAQLATYVRLARSGVPATAAYYMLAQSRILAADPWPFGDSYVSGSDLAATWREAAFGWETSWKQIDGGFIEATGVEEEDVEHPCAVVIEPPCRFCACGRLCGIKAVA